MTCSALSYSGMCAQGCMHWGNVTSQSIVITTERGLRNQVFSCELQSCSSQVPNERCRQTLARPWKSLEKIDSALLLCNQENKGTAKSQPKLWTVILGDPSSWLPSCDDKGPILVCLIPCFPPVWSGGELLFENRRKHLLSPFCCHCLWSK